MTIGVWLKKELPFSLSIYANEILKQFSLLGQDYYIFYDFKSIEYVNFDVIWHPMLSGLWYPESEFYSRKEQLVVTIHGVRPFIFEAENKLQEEFLIRQNRLKSELIEEWQRFQEKVEIVITPSKLSKKEIHQVYNIALEKIIPIYHGVNHDIFNSEQSNIQKKSQFLCVAQYQEVKNIKRLVSAFLNTNLPEEVKLILHLPGYKEEVENSRVLINRFAINEETLSHLYKSSIGFLFPSMHESFGLPVLEAMASGCPVLTSKSTGTAEICGHAAILVDPYCESEIIDGIEQLYHDFQLRNSLIELGLERAKTFTWNKSARAHIKAFKAAIDNLR